MVPNSGYLGPDRGWEEGLGLEPAEVLLENIRLRGARLEDVVKAEVPGVCLLRESCGTV